MAWMLGVAVVRLLGHCGPGRSADVAWGFLGPRYLLGGQADPQAGNSQFSCHTISLMSCPELGGV